MEQGPTTLRWLIDGPADGPTNMSRDEALLQQVGRRESPPTLRFYRWHPATISLGYFQAYSEFAALAFPAGDLAVVRRQTGGGAILHDLELTYALVLPLDHPLVARGRCNALYEHVHSVFAGLLARYGVPVTRGPLGAGGCSHRGPFFCFERHSCFDLLADGMKLMGSAQRRTSHAVLQHGSLVLDSRFPQQQCTTVRSCAPDFDIDAHLPEIARAVGAGPVVEAASLDAEERELAQQLWHKYAGRDWTEKR